MRGLMRQLGVKDTVLEHLQDRQAGATGRGTAHSGVCARRDTEACAAPHAPAAVPGCDPHRHRRGRPRRAQTGALQVTSVLASIILHVMYGEDVAEHGLHWLPCRMVAR